MTETLFQNTKKHKTPRKLFGYVLKYAGKGLTNDKFSAVAFWVFFKGIGRGVFASSRKRKDHFCDGFGCGRFVYGLVVGIQLLGFGNGSKKGGPCLWKRRNAGGQAILG
jgi:hypothetical protein